MSSKLLWLMTIPGFVLLVASGLLARNDSGSGQWGRDHRLGVQHGAVPSIRMRQIKKGIVVKGAAGGYDGEYHRVQANVYRKDVAHYLGWNPSRRAWVLAASQNNVTDPIVALHRYVSPPATARDIPSSGWKQ